MRLCCHYERITLKATDVTCIHIKNGNVMAYTARAFKDVVGRDCSRGAGFVHRTLGLLGSGRSARERCGARPRGRRGAAGAGGRAKAAAGGRRATYLLIRPRRKSPCIYFEWSGAGPTRSGGRGQTPVPVWRQKDSPAPRAPRRGHAQPCRAFAPAPYLI